MPDTKRSLALSSRGYGVGLLFWMLGITLASLLPVDDLGDSGWDFPYKDKLAHFVFYFGAMWLAGKAIQKGRAPGPVRKNRFWLAIAGLFFFGLVIEGLQMVLPAGRSAEWTDVLANALGIATALASLKRGFHEV